MPVTLTGRDELGRVIDVIVDTVANVPPPGPEEINAGPGGPTPTLAEVLAVGNDAEGQSILNLAGTDFGSILAAGNDAGGLAIAGLADPTDPQDAATKASSEAAAAARTLALVLLGDGVDVETANGNDTGGVGIVHNPAVDVAAVAGLNAVATGTGDAWTRGLAQVVDGDAVAGPRAEASGTGNTDACAYARSVDGSALADNDAMSTGAGVADAGGYASSVDGNSFTGGIAIATGAGNADASDSATANAGAAVAGSLAVRQGVSVGMRAIVDGTSGRMAFNGTTPIAIPEIPASPTEQDIADVLVALGLVTQAV